MNLKYIIPVIIILAIGTIYYLNQKVGTVQNQTLDVSSCKPNYTLQPKWLDIKDVNGIGYKYTQNETCLDGSKIKYFVINDVGYSDTGGEPLDDAIWYCESDNQYIVSGSRGYWGGRMLFEGTPCK